MIEHCDLQQFRPSVKADPKLVQNYLSSAPYYGDALVKRDLGQHKRTLTGLRKVLSKPELLDSSTTIALTAAIGGLEVQIKKLQTTCEWANELKAHFELDKQRKAGCNSVHFQASRWGDNRDAMNFELDLVRELTTRSGLADFCTWLHANNILSNVPTSQFFGPFKVCQTGQHEDQALICALMDLQYKSGAMTKGPAESSYVFGWLDYCSYLQYRRHKQADVQAILRSIAGK